MKRFGRNQKRKLKEALKLTDGLNRHLSELHSNDVKTLGRVRDVLGNHSALFDDPFIVSVKDENQKTISLDTVKLSPFNTLSNYPDQIGDMELHSTVLNLLEVSTHKDEILDAVNVKVRYRDGSIGYAISKQAMELLPKEYLIEKVSKEIARMLVDRFNLGR